MSRHCPNHDELANYALGKLSCERYEEIDMHLEQCDTCQAELETCGNADDTFLSRLSEPESSDEFFDEPECAEVMARVAAIGREPSFTTQQQLHRASDAAPDLADVGPYRLLARLGEGGMGTVYKAFHAKLERVVALKMLPAERMQDAAAIARFEREMKAVGKLVHPNIVLAHDAGEHEGKHFLVMEYVEGIDLSELARRHGPLTAADACEIVRRAALGLQHAHEHGLVHRDIKPSNLMLTREGTVKILDLGLALLPETGDEQRELTSAGQAMGTLDYMAPEQGDDSHRVDIRADIYALGATFYKLLGGEAPFGGPRYATAVKKLAALASKQPEPINARCPDIPARLGTIVHRMLAKARDERPSTPAEVVEALAPFCVGADLTDLYRRAAQGEESPESMASLSMADTPRYPSSALLDTASVAPKPLPIPQAASAWNRFRRWAIALGLVSATILLAVLIYIRNTRIEAPEGSEVKIDAAGSVHVTLPNDDAVGAAARPAAAVAPLSRERARQSQLAWTKRLGVPYQLENSIGMKFAVIPPGEFDMGLSPAEIKGISTKARALKLHAWFLDQLPMATPRRRVRITRPFLMSRAEVTQGNFFDVMGSNPSFHHPAKGSGPPSADGREAGKLPVEQVTWDEAVEFCRRLSARPEEKAAGRVYRLPSEAEWEYACRAGTTTFFSFGEHPKEANRYAWIGANSSLKTHPVRQKMPNAWGLYDMHGNVCEWCNDWFHHAYEPADPHVDPAGPGSGRYRVQRGGGMKDHAWMCLSAFRNRAPPEIRFQNTGFRVACEIRDDDTLTSRKNK